MSDVLSAKGFTTGAVGNSDGSHVKGSQVRAAKADDLGAQAVAKELGGLPVVADASLAPGSVRVVLANDYTGPGSGLSGGDPIVRRPARRTRSAAPTRTFPRRRRSSPPAPTSRSASTEPLTTLSGAILDPMLRADPVGPRITYYDDATGERIELSAVTLANWAAKTGNLLRDELGAGPGQPGRDLAARALADRGGAVRGVVDRRRGGARRPDRPISRCAPPTGSTRPTPPSARRRGGGAVAGCVRPPGARPADRRHRLRDRGAGARRPDRPRTPSGPGAGRPIGRRDPGRL